MTPLKEKSQEDEKDSLKETIVKTAETSNLKEATVSAVEMPSLRPRRSIVNYNENVLFNTQPKRTAQEISDSENTAVCNLN